MTADTRDTAAGSNGRSAMDFQGTFLEVMLLQQPECVSGCTRYHPRTPAHMGVSPSCFPAHGIHEPLLGSTVTEKHGVKVLALVKSSGVSVSSREHASHGAKSHMSLFSYTHLCSPFFSFSSECYFS